MWTHCRRSGVDQAVPLLDGNRRYSRDEAATKTLRQIRALISPCKFGMHVELPYHSRRGWKIVQVTVRSLATVV